MHIHKLSNRLVRRDQGMKFRLTLKREYFWYGPNNRPNTDPLHGCYKCY